MGVGEEETDSLGVSIVNPWEVDKRGQVWCWCERLQLSVRPGQPIGPSPAALQILHLLRFISWNVSGVEREGVPNRILQFQTFPPTLWVDTEDLIVKSQHAENRAMASQPAP